MYMLLRLVIIIGLISAGPSAAQTQREALIVTIDGAIGVATGEFIVDSLQQAGEADAEVVVLRMDTPGGLDSAMRDIIKAILASSVPVVTYVAPSGARAASAGTYILYASHVAAMAPATNLGAATPVQVGGGIPGTPEPDKPAGDQPGNGDAQGGDAMKRKLVNDAVAYIRGLAELRGRNADWAESAVREATSLSAGEALKMDVIDLMADDLPGLLSAIDGRSVQLPVGRRNLNTDGIGVRELEPGWRARLLSVITNPNVAYILMIIGIYGLIFELSNPGAVAPGVIGAVSLLLALYALHLLPVNYAGLALILLGVALMIAEAFAPSFGILGLGGLIAFLIGSVILMEDQEIGVAIPVIGLTALLSAAFSFWVLSRLVAMRHKSAVIGVENLTGSTGMALETFTRQGRVRVQGEIWQANSSAPVTEGERVKVLRVAGLRLEVEPEQENRDAL